MRRDGEGWWWSAMNMYPTSVGGAAPPIGTLISSLSKNLAMLRLRGAKLK